MQIIKSKSPKGTLGDQEMVAATAIDPTDESESLSVRGLPDGGWLAIIVPRKACDAASKSGQGSCKIVTGPLKLKFKRTLAQGLDLCTECVVQKCAEGQRLARFRL